MYVYIYYNDVCITNAGGYVGYVKQNWKNLKQNDC